jgi:Putative NADP-dependent oxidoreductases
MDVALNTRIVLARRPMGDPSPADFEFTQAPAPVPAEGELLLRTRLLSIDACARARARDTSFMGERMDVGEVMRCNTVAQVVRSRHPAFRPGDIVLAHTGWQDYDVVHGSQVKRKLYERVAPWSTALGVYGVYGFVAWSAMTRATPPRPGQTVLVGSATGPTGATAGQLAKLRGARVVGVTSSAEKCRWLLDEAGFDVAIDSRAPGFGEALREACPDGVDLFVPGLDYRVFDAALPLLNIGARLPVWGMTMYQTEDAGGLAQDRMAALMAAMVTRRLDVRAYNAAHDFTQLAPESICDPDFIADMGMLLRSGQLRYREEFVDGLENAPAALESVLRGENFGKLVVRVA